MIPVPSLRPLGDADLEAVRARVQERLAPWARAWLATPQWSLQSVGACSARELLDGTRATAEPLCLAFEHEGCVWLERTQLVELGLACVLDAQGLRGERQLDNVMADLGRSALDDLLRSLLDLPAATALQELVAAELDAAAFGRDGVRLSLQIGAASLALYLARSALTPWLVPLRSASPRLRALKLPASLGKAPCAVSAWSRPFEMSASDFLALAAGDVVTLDQRLDAAFELRIGGLPDATLKAFPGRCANALAVEVFENT